ncbi:hypothetical protein Tco_1234610 [Tanacetum coccineum]
MIEAARTMLNSANLPKQFWGEAVNTTPAERHSADCTIKAIKIHYPRPTNWKLYASCESTSCGKKIFGEKIKLDIVEHVKANYPQDPLLESAFRYTKVIQDLLSHISRSCPSINNYGPQLIEVIPRKKDKKVRFAESLTSTENTKPASTSNIVSNKRVLHSTGVRLSTSASGSQPSGNTKNDRILQTPSSNSKNKVEAHPRNVKSSLNKKNGTVNVNGSAVVQNLKKQDNSDYVCIHRDDSMSSDNLCVSNSLNVVKSRAKPKKNKSKKDSWKPTGKVFTQIGYIWRPTVVKIVYGILDSVATYAHDRRLLSARPIYLKLPHMGYDPLLRYSNSDVILIILLHQLHYSYIVHNDPHFSEHNNNDEDDIILVQIYVDDIDSLLHSTPEMWHLLNQSNMLLNLLRNMAMILVAQWFLHMVEEVQLDGLNEGKAWLGLRKKAPKCSKMDLSMKIMLVCQRTTRRSTSGSTTTLLGDRLVSGRLPKGQKNRCDIRKEAEDMLCPVVVLKSKHIDIRLMAISIADQIALDDALVAPADRLKIGKCNLRLSSDVTSKEATLQVVYDVLKLTPFYKAFQVTADAPENLKASHCPQGKGSIEKKTHKTTQSWEISLWPDLTEAEQLKIITKRSRQETHSSHASGSGADEGIEAQDDEDAGKNDVNETTQDDEDDDDHDDDEKVQDDDEHDVDETVQEDDDEELTESDDDGDDFVHPKLTTHDDDIIHEEDTDEDDSRISSSDDEDSDNEVEGANVEGAKTDEEATYEEDQGNEADEDTNTKHPQSSNILNIQQIHNHSVETDSGQLTQLRQK